MANQTSGRGAKEGGGLSNFVGGRQVPTVDGKSAMLVDPSTGEEYLEAPVSGAEQRDEMRLLAAAVEGLALRATAPT